MDLIDIHCHILPGVDDGSKSMEESLAMLRIAQQNAIRTIIVTPHNKPGRHNIHIPSMNVYIKQLQEQMGRAGLSIELIGRWRIPDMYFWNLLQWMITIICVMVSMTFYLKAISRL